MKIRYFLKSLFIVILSFVTYNELISADQQNTRNQNTQKHSEKPGIKYADIEPANKIDIEFSLVNFEISYSKFRYEYKLISKRGSKQNVTLLYLLDNTNEIISVKTPENWRQSPLDNFLGWSSRSREDNIRPGDNLPGFLVIATGLPGIVTFQAKGWVEPPWYPYGEAPPLPPGYDSRKNFFFGKTVAPVPLPENYNHKKFIDYLITMVVQMSEELNWIDTKKVDTMKWVELLEEAQKNIKWWKSKKDAVMLIQKFINEVDAQKENSINLEAWAVMKFNSQFLLQKLGVV